MMSTLLVVPIHDISIHRVCGLLRVVHLSCLPCWIWYHTMHSNVGAGIWHTGLIVYGKEYFFGGGLQSMPHNQFVQMHGGVGPTEYIELGSTDLSQVCVFVCTY